MPKSLAPEVFAICQTSLAEQFPALFNPAQKVPLKVGVHRDLVAKFPGNKSVLRLFLNEWCATPDYWQAMRTVGAMRWGCDGPEGAVTEREAAYAEDRLRRHAKKLAQQTDVTEARAA